MKTEYVCALFFGQTQMTKTIPLVHTSAVCFFPLALSNGYFDIDVFIGQRYSQQESLKNESSIVSEWWRETNLKYSKWMRCLLPFVPPFLSLFLSLLNPNHATHECAQTHMSYSCRGIKTGNTIHIVQSSKNRNYSSTMRQKRERAKE